MPRRLFEIAAWLTLGLLLVWGSPALGEAEREMLDCDEAVTTLEVNACLAKRVRQSEAVMKAYWLASQAAVADGDSARQGLDEAQGLWRRYRDSQCGAIFEYWKDGTIRTAMQLGCQKDMNLQRARFLWQAYLQPMDGSEGNPPALSLP